MLQSWSWMTQAPEQDPEIRSTSTPQTAPGLRHGQRTTRASRRPVSITSPRSVRIIKRQIYTGLLQNFDQAYEAALEEMRGSFGTEDFREGVAHYLEKRAAAFTGR